MTPTEQRAGKSTRTVADVIAEWRASGVNNDDGELASRINYFIATETKGWRGTGGLQERVKQWRGIARRVDSPLFNAYSQCADELEADIAEMGVGVSNVGILSLLNEHWLFGIECNHEAKTDQSICSCGLKSPERESVGAAVQDWIKHLRTLAVTAPSSEQQPHVATLEEISCADAAEIVREAAVPASVPLDAAAVPFSVAVKLDQMARRTTILAMELAYKCLKSFTIQSTHPEANRVRDICYTLLGVKYHRAEPDESGEWMRLGVPVPVETPSVERVPRADIPRDKAHAIVRMWLELEGGTPQEQRDRLVEDIADALRAASDRERVLREVASNVPDPEVGGFCDSCGGRLELIETQRHGMKAFIWQHKETCWYGKLQTALALDAVKEQPK